MEKQEKTIAPRRLRKGDVIEFVTTYPGHEGETVRGEVFDVPGLMYPFNPCVHTPFGQQSVLNSEVGKSITIVSEVTR